MQHVLSYLEKTTEGGGVDEKQRTPPPSRDRVKDL